MTRTARWLLIVSLALNVALATALALSWFAHGHHRGHDHAAHGHGHARVPGPWALKRALPEARHAMLEAVFAEHRAAIRAAVREVHDARQATRRAMQDEPFDPSALEQAFATLRQRDAAAAASVQALLADVLSRLTPEERARVAEHMHKRRHGKHDRAAREP